MLIKQKWRTMMLKKTLLLTLIVSFFVSGVLLAKTVPKKVYGDFSNTVMSIDELEQPMQTTNGINFKNYIISGTVLGTSTFEFATAYFGRNIAVGIDNVVHTTWSTLGDPSNETYYCRSTDHGKTWSTPVEVQDGYYGYKPSIAVDPTDPTKVYIAYVGYQNQGQTRSVRVSASTDGGLTWGASAPIYGSVLDCNNPTILVDGRGWVHVGFDNYTDSYIYYNFSADGGQTWMPFPIVVTVGFSDDTFSANLAADQNHNIHILTGGGGTTGSWGDKGTYWTWLDMSYIVPGMTPLPQEVPPVELAPAGTGMPYPSMVFDSKNVGHLFYDNVATNVWRSVYYRTYQNGTWADPVEIPSINGGGNGGASCAIDAEDNLYLAFHDVIDGELGWAWEVWPVDIVTGTNISGEWKFVNVTADGQGVNQQYMDCASFVSSDSILHLIYVTGTAAPYSVVHEVGFPWPPEPTIGLNDLPDTYFANADFKIKATTGDIDGFVTGATIHVWKNGEKIVDGVAMTETVKNKYEYMLALNASVNDFIEYQGVALDNDGNIKLSLTMNFTVLAPQNPGADLLIVSNDGRIPEFWDTVLSSITTSEGDPYLYETWNVAEHGGIDASVTTFGWSTILLHGWNTSSIPTRDYEGNAYAAFLQSGTADAPKNLFLSSMDYFYANDEPGSPEELVFEAGDFAYDFLGVASGTSDPLQDADSVLIGTAGDPISGSFADMPLVLRPWATDEDGTAIANWIDWTAAIAYDNDIFIAESQGMGSGVKYDGGDFKTVFMPWMLCHLVQDTLVAAKNTAQPEAITLVNNILHWFGTNKDVSVDERAAVVVDKFELGQNYPNPFNPVTHIDYQLSQAANVEMVVFNSLGQKIKLLVNQKVAAGQHTISWDGTNDAGQLVASGTYFYKVVAGDFVKINKMVLLK
jgi:hypothetical protein